MHCRLSSHQLSLPISQIHRQDPERKDGFSAPATLFAEVEEDMRVATGEMLGTIVAAMPFDTFRT